MTAEEKIAKIQYLLEDLTEDEVTIGDICEEIEDKPIYTTAEEMLDFIRICQSIKSIVNS